jgi:hypothetical protein
MTDAHALRLQTRLDLLKAYDPNQARDSHGRWTRSGVPDTTGGFAHALGEASGRVSQIAGHVSNVTGHVARAAAAHAASNYAYLAYHTMQATAALGQLYQEARAAPEDFKRLSAETRTKLRSALKSLRALRNKLRPGKVQKLMEKCERIELVLKMVRVPKREANQIIRKASRIKNDLGKMVAYTEARPYRDEDDDFVGVGGRAGASDGGWSKDEVDDTFDPAQDSPPRGMEAGGMSQDATQRRRRPQRIKLGSMGDLGTPGSQLRVIGRRRVL